MSTFMANKGNIERKWYILDAAGKPLGKTAALAATLLRGKHKPEYTPHADCGDYVIVINAEKAVLTGKKLEQKYYRTHSGWVGGLKETQYSRLMKEKPELAMKLAVRGARRDEIAAGDERPLGAFGPAPPAFALYRPGTVGRCILQVVVEHRLPP